MCLHWHSHRGARVVHGPPWDFGTTQYTAAISVQKTKGQKKNPIPKWADEGRSGPNWCVVSLIDWRSSRCRSAFLSSWVCWHVDPLPATFHQLLYANFILTMNLLCLQDPNYMCFYLPFHGWTVSAHMSCLPFHAFNYFNWQNYRLFYLIFRAQVLKQSGQNSLQPKTFSAAGCEHRQANT